ncbi:MAG: 50S ribosomal protein L18 [bacterium]|nr:50S ribosomal protein L18 [bacterium]
MSTSTSRQKLTRRHARVRAKISGTAKCPRISVSRSSRHIQAQLIDDEKNVTLFGMSDLKAKKGTKTERAGAIGAEIAKAAADKGIKEVVFDRGGFKYHGRVKALAEAVRRGGIKF